MNAAMMQSALQSDFSSPTRASSGTGAVTGMPRILLRLEGAAALIGATFAYSAVSGLWSMFALLLLVPDLSMLGYLINRRIGAACYNAAHSYVGPGIIASLGTTLGRPALLGVACIWIAHVGFDRALGYGLKYGTAFGDTHLGRVGARTTVSS